MTGTNTDTTGSPVAEAITAERRSLAELFGGSRLYRVPTYQRSFAEKHLSMPRIVRFVLSELERKLSGNAEKVAGPDALTVEGILPKNPDSSWPKALRMGPKHAALLSRIGNLTLLTEPDNSSAPNAYKDKKLLHASSSLVTTSTITATSWNQTAIQQRQKDLADAAADVWRI